MCSKADGHHEVRRRPVRRAAAAIQSLVAQCRKLEARGWTALVTRRRCPASRGARRGLEWRAPAPRAAYTGGIPAGCGATLRNELRCGLLRLDDAMQTVRSLLNKGITSHRRALPKSARFICHLPVCMDEQRRLEFTTGGTGSDSPSFHPGPFHCSIRLLPSIPFHFHPFHPSHSWAWWSIPK